MLANKTSSDKKTRKSGSKFLSKLYTLVSDPNTDHIISWHDNKKVL